MKKYLPTNPVHNFAGFAAPGEPSEIQCEPIYAVSNTHPEFELAILKVARQILIDNDWGDTAQALHDFITTTQSVLEYSRQQADAA